MKPIDLQQKIEKMNYIEPIYFIFDNNYLHKEYFCLKCNLSWLFVMIQKNTDLFD